MASAGLGQLSTSASLALAAAAPLAVGAALLRARPRLVPSGSESLLLLLLALGVWRLLPVGAPLPVFLDASWYLNTGLAIAREGSLDIEQPLRASLQGSPELERLVTATFEDQRQRGLPFPSDPERGFHNLAFAVDRLGAPEGQVSPYHPPFMAAGVALWARLFGPDAASRVILPWALAYLLGLVVLARRAAGDAEALLALGFMVCSPGFLYFGGNPYAEIPAGALLLGGLGGLSATLRPTDHDRPLALASGLCLGLAALCKLDLWPALALASAWGLWRFFRDGRGAVARWLLLGLLPGLALVLRLAMGPTALYYRLNLGGVLALLAQNVFSLAALGLVAMLLAVAWRARRPSGSETRRLLGIGLLVALATTSLSALLLPADQPPSMVGILAWLASPLGLWAAASGLLLALERRQGSEALLVFLAFSAPPLGAGCARGQPRALAALYRSSAHAARLASAQLLRGPSSLGSLRVAGRDRRWRAPRGCGRGPCGVSTDQASCALATGLAMEPLGSARRNPARHPGRPECRSALGPRARARLRGRSPAHRGFGGRRGAGGRPALRVELGRLACWALGRATLGARRSDDGRLGAC